MMYFSRKGFILLIFILCISSFCLNAMADDSDYLEVHCEHYTTKSLSLKYLDSIQMNLTFLKESDFLGKEIKFLSPVKFTYNLTKEDFQKKYNIDDRINSLAGEKVAYIIV